MGARRRKNLSPRYLTFRHARGLLRRQGLLATNDGDLPPGHQRLHSYMTPGLQGGGHTITTTQEIDGQPDALQGTQPFYVDKLLFQLPEGDVHSVYPPQGHQEWAEALPHVVFNTPSTPWEWAASDITDEEDYEKTETECPGWRIFRDIDGMNDEDKPVKQTKTLSVPMQFSDIERLRHTVSPVANENPPDPTATAELIFLKKELFTGLFCKHDEEGQPVMGADSDVRPYRFLAHRRDINATGMAKASKTATEDDQQSYSVILSHRTGPTSAAEPINCIAHLVSIRGIEAMPRNNIWPIPDTAKFVAMSSLYSWSYSCYPTTTPNIHNQFVTLGESCRMLRSVVTEKDLAGSGDLSDVQKRVLLRLDNGYTMARYRVKTGEFTACFTRGAFVPVKNVAVEDIWGSLSNTGNDLQILDQQLGIMDITYAAAWQLGRTMAIADPAFVTSLGLVRKNIYDLGMYYYHLEDLPERSRGQIIAALPSMVSSLRLLQHSKQLSAQDPASRARRWFRPSVKPIDLSYARRTRISLGGGEEEDPKEKHFRQAAREIASGCKKDNPDEPSSTPYNEFNTPFSADWMTVLKWMIDRLAFTNMPAHYLVTDSSHLPEESIRFFEVDTRWMNAMIDGALSLANYIDQEDDMVRRAIFHAINLYRSTEVPEINMKPPLARYGCYIRSGLITKFPDLKVEVRKGDESLEEDDTLHLLRHDIVNTDTMLCLFSLPPDEAPWDQIWLTQPPHQQSFVAGAALDDKQIKVPFRRAYTNDSWKTDPQLNDPLETPIWEREQGADGPDGAIYHWTDPNSSVEVRRLSMDFYAQKYLSAVQTGMDKGQFDDTIASSALMATQMSSFAWRLKIKFNGSTFQAVQAEPVKPLTQSSQPAATPSFAPLLKQPEPLAPNYPRIRYRIRSTDSPQTRTITSLRISQDLIFNIYMEDGWDLDLRLQYISLTVLLRDPSTSNELALMKNYTGSGAYMLSNVRFNPLVTLIENDEGVNTELVIKLVPRAVGTNERPPDVNLINCRELSFVLSGVMVNDYGNSWPDISFQGCIKEKYTESNEEHTPSTVDDVEIGPEQSTPKTMKETRAAFLRSVALP
ncbi:hypothetical protein AARAC_009926 [Aspergillus arachidicola]|uniref:Uncharacterized protein n=1 Tax=Aspergillus arachidicola TaxID=656916 RepID=A0A2G7FV61_9EURO|nr:hypothetical protein AARAC_009926 [Aspergillus arachidicola]